VDKITVVSGIDLELVPGYLALNLSAEMLENPSDVNHIEIPFKKAEDDEIINSGISILIVLR
jgi:hypothetical protein